MARLLRPSLGFLLLYLATSLHFTPCSGSWLFGLIGSEGHAARPVHSWLTFEAAMQTAFRDIPAATATEQYGRMLEWFPKLSLDLQSNVQELQNSDVAAITSSASKMGQARLDDPSLSATLLDISGRLDQLSTQAGYPLTRRIVMAGIVKQRMSGGPFAQPVQGLVDDVLLRLFKLHQLSAAHKGIIQFFHISKSGGTNMCMAAETNGCTTEGFNERSNCLVRDFHDHPRWATYTAHKFVQHSMHQATNTPWFVNFGAMRKAEMSCAQRSVYLREKNWNFYANEFTVPTGELGICSEFVNLMIFRNPIDRLSSQISWIQKLYKSLYNASDISKAFKGRTSTFWERLTPAAVNNYYTRSLLGTRFFQTPVLSVNATHVQRAMLKVLQHDLLMMLEHKEFNDLVLQVGLGWQNSIKDDKIRSSSDIKKEIVMPIDYDRLINRNRPDVEVHKFAESLQLLDVLLFKFILLADPSLETRNKNKSCGYVHTPPSSQ